MLYLDFWNSSIYSFHPIDVNMPIQKSIFTKIKSEIENLLFVYPLTMLPGSVGKRLRYIYWKQHLKEIGKNVFIDIGVQFVNPEYITIKDNVWIDKYVILIAGPPQGQRNGIRKENHFFSLQEGELYIGQNVHIAPHCVIQAHGGVWLGNNLTVASGCRIYSLSHHYRNLSDTTDPTEFLFTSLKDLDSQYLISGAVVMCNATALGLNSIILPGATIHEGSWVACMSVVTKDIPAGVIAGGNPAAAVKKKFQK
jgi:acetyltransferase-like isoleucine patch superfamily enzyme